MQENNQYHYSVYGYLDVSADTQWVRVTPVRGQLRPTGEPLDATVTLENLSNGETIVMNDSLIQTFGATFPVVWATEKIEPDTPYEMRIQGTEQRESRAEVHTPHNIPTPLVYVSPNPPGRPHAIFVENVEKLVDVRITYCVRAHGAPESSYGLYSIPITDHRVQTSEGFPNRYRIDVKEIEDHLPPRDTHARFERQFTVYVSNDTWPDFTSFEQFEQELPEGAASNVEEGVGFLGAVLSKSVPFEMCYDENGDWVACEPEPRVTSPLDCLDGGEFDPPS